MLTKKSQINCEFEGFWLGSLGGLFRNATSIENMSVKMLTDVFYVGLQTTLLFYTSGFSISRAGSMYRVFHIDLHHFEDLGGQLKTTFRF